MQQTERKSKPLFQGTPRHVLEYISFPMHTPVNNDQELATRNNMQTIIYQKISNTFMWVIK